MKTGRPRKYKNNAEKQKAYRERKKKASQLQTLSKAIQITNNQIIAEQTIDAKLDDTRSMSWYDWALDYLNIILLPHQITNLELLETYNKCMINDPRQHGKTNYVVKVFILRKLCESVFTGPLPILYISHSLPGVVLMTLKIKEELIQNDKIVNNYGMLIDYETFKQSRFKKQTQNIINLRGTRVDSHTFQGVSTASRIRGTSAIKYTIIDDPIDVEREEETEAATRKFLQWLKYKVLPLTRGGNVFIIGTRYGIKDLYITLREEKVYHYIQRSAVEKILPYTVDYPESGPLKAEHILPEDESQWELLAPTLWEQAYSGTTVQNIIYEFVSLGHRATQQELMNNPIPLQPLIKWEWIHQYERLIYPDWAYNWAVMVDVAAGESEGADYTAFVLVAEKDNKYFIHDIQFGKWTGKEKQDRLEEFIRSNQQSLHKDVSIKLLIETVMNQRDFYQRVRDESHLTPKAISPSKRKDKLTRITHGLGQEAENGQVYLFQFCRNKRQFQMEIEGFPKLKEDHILDAADQAIHYLKGFKRHPRVKAGWL